MKQALFHNFTDKPFTGHWNGKPYTFKPGFKKQMVASIAAHFAKHLTNQELLKKGGEFENYTSPKKPEQVPQFMEIFNLAYLPLPDEVDELGMIPDPVMGNGQPSMNVNVQRRQVADPYDANAQPIKTGPGEKSTVITGPDGGIVEDEESEFADGNTDESAEVDGEGE